MFCPNCGTKNADTEAKCAQCGFDLQAKAPQARFKGTMVMAPTAAKPAEPAPAAPAAASPAPAPAKGGSLKGTMIGVAPPEMARALEEAKAKAAAQAAASAPKAGAATPPAAAPAGTKPSLKGTMIGVAPPDMQAAIAAAKAKVTGGDTGPLAGSPTAPAPAAPSAVTGPTSAAQGAKPSIKGTMIGVAPPDMQAAIAAHKAELEKRVAADAASTVAQAATEPPPPAAPKPASPLGRASTSKLKGTMIGVAPPDVSQSIAEAKANANALAEAKAAAASAETPPQGVAALGRAGMDRPAPNPDFGATMVGTAAPVTESLRPGPTASRTPSGQFGGTMVGSTSPLMAGDVEEQGPDSRAKGNSDHPAAFASTSLSDVSEIAAARENLQRVMAEAEGTPRPPNGRDIPTGAQSPAALRSAAQASKKNSLPVLLLGVALLIVAVLIGVALMSRSKAADEKASEEAAKPAPTAAPAP